MCPSSSMAASQASTRRRRHLDHVDGVMLGRAAYQEPWRLLAVDPELFGEAAPHAAMKDVFEAMMPYIERELAHGTRLHSITRHFVGAFHGVPGARAFRRHLAENGVKAGRRRRCSARCDRAGRGSRGGADRRVIASTSRIAVQHQPVGADFPAFQPVQKAHAEQIGFHLAVRHHQRRHRALDQLADRRGGRASAAPPWCVRRRSRRSTSYSSSSSGSPAAFAVS